MQTLSDEAWCTNTSHRRFPPNLAGIGLLRALRVSTGLATDQWVAALQLYKLIQQPINQEAHPERTPSPVVYRSACLVLENYWRGQKNLNSLSFMCHLLNGGSGLYVNHKES
jgi:hypothetical protein